MSTDSLNIKHLAYDNLKPKSFNKWNFKKQTEACLVLLNNACRQTLRLKAV